MELTPELKFSVGLIGLKPETDGIAAIKALRSALGLSLREAKAKYDAIKEGKSCFVEFSPEAAAIHIPLLDALFSCENTRERFLWSCGTGSFRLSKPRTILTPCPMPQRSSRQCGSKRDEPA
jgi:hypothetical protein